MSEIMLAIVRFEVFACCMMAVASLAGYETSNTLGWITAASGWGTLLVRNRRQESPS